MVRSDVRRDETRLALRTGPREFGAAAEDSRPATDIRRSRELERAQSRLAIGRPWRRSAIALRQTVLEVGYIHQVIAFALLNLKASRSPIDACAAKHDVAAPAGVV